jgi:hypothetical protein
MRSRILLGVAAWLVGASAATGGSLRAVSMLGQGTNPAAGEQVSVETVNRALARESAERTAATPRRTASPGASPTKRPQPGPRHPAAPPSPRTTGGTVLTSQGGTLVASCAGSRAYLVSWSPQQSFGSADVVRGPAAKAQAVFISGQLTVTVVVSCDGGVPTAVSTTVSTGGGEGD